MVAPPEFEYRAPAGGQPTLTLPLVTVRGGGGGDQMVVTQAGATEPIVPDDTVQNPLRDSEVNITVSSRYYQAWGRFFKQQTAGSVTYNHAANNVTIQLTAPNRGPTLDNAIMSDSGTLAITSNPVIDSYDSSVGPYDAGPNFKARVASAETYDMQSGTIIKGSLDVKGTSTFDSSNIVVHRAVRVGGTSGTTDIQNAQSFKRDVHVGGDLTVSTTHDPFKRGLFIGGNLDQMKAGVDGELHVGEDAKLNKKADLDDDVVVGGDVTTAKNKDELGGTLHVGGNVTLAEQADVKTVIAGGDVTLEGKATTTDVFAGGTVTIENQNVQVNGDVRAGEDIKIPSGGDINGNATANDDIVLSDSGAEITGDAVAGDDINAGSGTIGGTTTEDASLGSVKSPRSPTEPAAPSIPTYEPATDEIDDTETALSGSNDNDDVPDISGETLDSCNSGCTLPAGEYYLDSTSIQGSGTLTLNTTNGDITIYVQNDISWKGTVSVVGDGQVEVYGNGDFTFKGDMQNPDHRASQFWVYLKPGRAADVTSNARFIGVIYGPGTPSNNLDVNLGSNSEVYGAVVGEVDADSTSQLHYDLALRSETAFGTNTTTPKVTYLQISQTKIRVE